MPPISPAAYLVAGGVKAKNSRNDLAMAWDFHRRLPLGFALAIFLGFFAAREARAAFDFRKCFTKAWWLIGRNPEHDFRLVPHTGRPVRASELDFSLRLHIPEGARVSRLGGRNNGEVFLVAEGGAKPFALKRYSFTGEHALDVLRLRMLEAALPPGPGNFRVVGHRELKNDVLRLEYVPGRTVADLLQDKRVPEALKERLRATHKTRLDNALAALKAQHKDAYIDGRDFIIVRTHDGYTREINLDHTNVVVSDLRTLEMTIIDPY